MKLFFTALIAIASLPLFSQTKTSLPKWISTPPRSTATEQKVVSSGATIQEARHNAINLLIGLTNINKDEKSYQKRRLDSGQEPVSQHQALVAAAENSLYFKNLNVYEGDGECWVLCSMTSKDLAAFSDSLYQAILTNTYNSIKRARSLRQVGDLYGSAKIYSEALHDIVPMLHKDLSCEEGDLIDIIHKEYVSSLDGIELKFDYANCPFVKGEEVPFDILVSATYQGLPVSAMPLTFKISEDGKVTEKGKTDGKGRAKTRILAAPSKDNGTLMVYTDLMSLSATLPQNIFFMELTQHLALEPKQTTMLLSAFDPTPTYSVEFADKTMECISDSVHALMKRGGNRLAEDAGKADLLLSVSLTTEQEGEATPGKYAMQYNVCGMTVTLTDRRTQKELAKAEKTGLRLFLPANTEEEKIKTLAVSELYKRMKIQLKKIQDVTFDKRKVVYSEM